MHDGKDKVEASILYILYIGIMHIKHIFYKNKTCLLLWYLRVIRIHYNLQYNYLRALSKPEEMQPS